METEEKTETRGRPNTKNGKRVCLYLAEQNSSRLDFLAGEMHMSRSQYVDWFVEQKFKNSFAGQREEQLKKQLEAVEEEKKNCDNDATEIKKQLQDVQNNAKIQELQNKDLERKKNDAVNILSAHIREGRDFSEVIGFAKTHSLNMGERYSYQELLTLAIEASEKRKKILA